MYLKTTIILMLSFSLFLACKKSSKVNEGESTPASVSTVELTSVRSSAVYGVDITFKVKINGIGAGDQAIDQYGIVYKAWIGSETDKIPTNATGAIILIHDTPSAGATIEKKVTLTFAQFNDANYRAFVRLKNGTYLYGDVKYFVSV